MKMDISNVIIGKRVFFRKCVCMMFVAAVIITYMFSVDCNIVKADEWDDAVKYYSNYGNAAVFKATNKMNGNIYFCSAGNTSTSGTKYRTIGYKMTIKGTGGNEIQKIYFQLGGQYLTLLNSKKQSGKEYMLYVITLQNIKTRFNEQALNALSSGSCTIVLDACMVYDNQNLDETAIARRCNDLGYRTKRGKLFERRSVDRILGNPFYCGTVVWNGVEFEGSHEVRLSRERYEKRQKLITSRKRPVKARNVSACKHWLSGLLKCSVCGATLSYTGNNKCPYFQCWKYAKGFHKTSVALSVKKAEEAAISYFDQILDGAEFTYVCKKKKTDHSLQIEQLQREISKLTMRESRIKEAYEAGVDTLEEYKNNKDRLVSDRLELTAALSQLLQEEQADQPDTEEILKEIRSVADVLKNPDVGYEEKGNLIRSVVEQIIYDKESGKMSFDIIIS